MAALLICIYSLFFRLPRLCIRQFPVDPCHEQIYDFLLSHRVKRYALWHAIPLFKTAAATACTGMLSNKNRMSAHGRLLTVIRRKRRRKTRAHKIGGMPADHVPALFLRIGFFFFGQMKFTPKIRFFKPRKGFFVPGHGYSASGTANSADAPEVSTTQSLARSARL